MLFEFLMNASQVMLHILFLEFFDIILYKLHHILFRVVGFLPQTLVGKHSQTAIALKGTRGYLKLLLSAKTQKGINIPPEAL